ncbi:MAG: hypothetical protein R2705_20330 [Ilumatobacteraceae bacterium]
MVHALVPEGLERQRRKGVVGEFSLLQAHDIGVDVMSHSSALEPGFQELTFQVARRTVLDRIRSPPDR